MPFVLFSPLAPVRPCVPRHILILPLINWRVSSDDDHCFCFCCCPSLQATKLPNISAPPPTEPYAPSTVLLLLLTLGVHYCVTTSQFYIDYQSTASSSLCPLICKSITIARTQGLSPSPSVLCLQPERRLCCCTMLFLLSKAGSWIKPRAVAVFHPSSLPTSINYHTATSPPQATIAALSRRIVPLLQPAVLLLTTRACFQ